MPRIPGMRAPEQPREIMVQPVVTMLGSCRMDVVRQDSPAGEPGWLLVFTHMSGVQQWQLQLDEGGKSFLVEKLTGVSLARLEI